MSWLSIPNWIRWIIKVVIIIIICILLKAELNVSSGVLKVDANIGYRGLSVNQHIAN